MKLRTSSVVLLTLTLLAATSPVMADEAVNQGVTVHGHWKIEVFEPDGSLVSVHEFENSLTATGASHLAQSLERSKTQGLWAIRIDGPASQQPCALSASPNPCWIFEPGDPIAAGPAISKNLTVSASGGQVTLTGSVVVNPVDATPEVNLVATRTSNCPSTVAPASCTESALGTESFDFSSASITPVSVQNSQIVAVTVTLSFS